MSVALEVSLLIPPVYHLADIMIEKFKQAKCNK